MSKTSIWNIHRHNNIALFDYLFLEKLRESLVNMPHEVQASVPLLKSQTERQRWLRLICFCFSEIYILCSTMAWFEYIIHLLELVNLRFQDCLCNNECQPHTSVRFLFWHSCSHQNESNSASKIRVICYSAFFPSLN